jgi:hypothetical protein
MPGPLILILRLRHQKNHVGISYLYLKFPKPAATNATSSEKYDSFYKLLLNFFSIPYFLWYENREAMEPACQPP